MSSVGEITFALHCRVHGLLPEPQLHLRRFLAHRTSSLELNRSSARWVSPRPRRATTQQDTSQMHSHG